jgi:ribosomal protein S18 acetylase RimI-like enzyme
VTPRVREALPKDAPQLVALRVEAGWDADAVPAWFLAMQRAERDMWVAELEGRVVAMVAVDYVDADTEYADGSTTAAVTSLAVTASAARQGLGRFLTRFAEAQATARGVKVLTLCTKPSNKAALSLYESLGYSTFKQEPRPWGEAVFLRKHLKAAP